MPLIDLSLVLGALADLVVEGTWDWAKKHEETQKLLRKIGRDFDPASAQFDDIYRYTLVLFGIGMPAELTELFTQPAVRRLIRQAYELNDVGLLEAQASETVEWSSAEKLLKKYDITPQRLLTAFSEAFQQSVDRSRTVVEVRHEQKLDIVVDTAQQALSEIVDLKRHLVSDRVVQETGIIPSSPAEANYDMQIDQARDLILEEEYSAALSLLRKLEKQFRNEDTSDHLLFRTLTNIGACLLHLGPADSAVPFFEEAYELQPNNTAAMTNAAYARLVDGDYGAAVRMAKRALQREPDHSAALGVLIDALARDNQLDQLDEVLLKQAEDVPEGRRALAVAYLNSHQYQEAEDLLRISVESDSCELQDRMLYSQTILMPLHQQSASAGAGLWPSSDEQRQRLTSAEDQITQVIDAWQIAPNRDRLHSALLVRMNIRILEGKPKLAAADADSVLRENPDNLQALAGRATLALEEGDFRYAEQLLERYLGFSDADQQMRIPLSIAYIQNSKFEVALELLTDDRWDIASVTFPVKMDRLILVAQVAHRRRNQALIDSVRNQLDDLPPDDPLVLHAKASCALLDNDFDVALELLNRAREIAVGPRKDRLTLEIADLHFEKQQFGPASKMYAEVVTADTDTPPTRRYLIALLNSGDWQRAYHLSSAIRAGGDAVPVISEVEARVAEYTGDLDQALDLYNQLSEVEPSNPEHLLRMATIRMRQGESQAAAEQLHSQIERFYDDPQALIHIAKILAAAKQSAPAILQLAYHARRLAPDDPEIHLAYMQLFFRLENDPELQLEFGTVAIDTSVRLESEDETLWLTIIDKTPDRTKNEYGPRDPVARKLLGLGVDAEVVLKEGPLERREYRIAEIKSKYVRALQETMLSFGHWFPEHPGLSRVRIEDGDFSLLLQATGAHSQFVRRMQELYTSGQLTLEGFAQVIGRNTAEVWRSMQWEGAGLLVSRGDPHEQAYHRSLVESTKRVTVDISSLLTLHRLGHLDTLAKAFDAVYVPQTVIDTLIEDIQRLQHFERDYGALGIKDGRFIFEEIPREAITNNINILQEIIDFVRGNLQIRPADMALEIELQHFELSERFIGQASTAAVLVAKETGSVLYADDLLLRQIARRFFEVDGIWTQPMLHVAVQRQVIDPPQYWDAVAAMAQNNYSYVPLNAAAVVHILAQNNWIINSTVEDTLKPVSDARTTDPYTICVDIVIQTWQHPINLRQKTNVLDLCLRTVSKTRDASLAALMFRYRLQEHWPKLRARELRFILPEIELWRVVHRRLRL